MNTFIDEPLKQYDSVYKEVFHENCKELLDKTVEKSNVDRSENISTCNTYYKEEEKFNNTNKRVKKLKTIRVFMFIFLVLTLALPFLLYNKVSGELKILAIAGPVAVALLLIVLIFCLINGKIKTASELAREIQEDMAKLKDEAMNQLKPLYCLFNHLTPKRLIEKTFPLFKIDDYFVTERYFSMVEKYDYLKELDQKESAVNVVSGTYNNNPFTILSTMSQEMQDKVYTGTKTIHYTTVERGSDGKLHTQHHTEVLTATSVHPVPVYIRNNALIFASDAAPDLSFSRKPSGVKGLSEKQVDKKIDKLTKQIEKKSKKSVGTSNEFTAMANNEFEALFNATDRDNEVQFRMLFTPLAQRNEIASIKDNKYFGDDFSFFKNKKLNYISSEHSQGFDYSGNPLNYVSFDIRKVEELFMEYNENYFKNFFFDFIPLLNIPLYQQTVPTVNVNTRNYAKWGRNFTCYEVESLANQLEDELAPRGAKTRSILKTTLTNSVEGKDAYIITANSFSTMPRVDYVPRTGGDGRTYMVPVPWEEFLPLVSKNFFEVALDDGDGEQWEIQERGLKARRKV